MEIVIVACTAIICLTMIYCARGISGSMMFLELVRQGKVVSIKWHGRTVRFDRQEK